MAFKGKVVPIYMGQGGLHTDDSPSAIPPTDLILANNVSTHENLIEKSAGAVRFNPVPIPNGIFGAIDFWRDSTLANRRMIVLGGNGRTYQIDNAGAATEITGGVAPAVLTVSDNQAYFLPCGKEAAIEGKKLFLFTGVNPVQVIVGPSVVRDNISGPPADWTGTTQPTFGIVHRNRVFAGGNLNNPHTMYASAATNHQDFTTAPITLQCYPGDNEKLIGAMIYKSRLWVFKYPYGAYLLEDGDFDPTKWYFTKAETQFGFASPHSLVQILNDVFIKNASDSITSVQATLNFGDIAIGDVLNLLKINQYVRDNTDSSEHVQTHGVYYPDKKVALFTYKTSLSSQNDRILQLQILPNVPPKASFLTFAKPNILAMRKDSDLIERPIYGSLDGFVYLMDQPARSVEGISYTGEFQTPDLDFGFVDTSLLAKNKNWSFLELRYVPQGDWSVFADIYVDGNFTETVEFPMSGYDLLAGNVVEPNDFMLSDSSTDPDGSFLAGEDLLTIRKRISGTGRTISVRIRNSGLDQTFKIATMIFSFQPSGEQQR